jgi:iron(III) transport system ATP-binding protein
MARITIEHLSKHYAGADGPAALHDLSLAVADNRFLTLLGPSGCGKTTTLRLIAGYLRPDAGTIAVDERILSSPDGVVLPENRGMGMVFQNYAVWPHKTVFQNVAFGLQVRRKPATEIRERVSQMLDIVGLSGFESRLPNEISGGQQQRVALARSLVVEPDILLLDEPLSNLDAKLRERMRVELKQIQRRTGITFVYVTHDQAEALALSDDVAVLYQGQLQQFGGPREIYTRPANRIVADFMGQVNFIPGRLAAVQGETARLTLDGGFEVTVPRPNALAAGAAVDLAIRPENLRLGPPSGSGLPAKVAETTYLGSTVEYVVETGGLRLRVQTHPSQVFAVGEAVAVEFDPAQCTLFARA